jgi:hypothetical protein
VPEGRDPGMAGVKAATPALQAVMEINQDQPTADKVRGAVGDLRGGRSACWGWPSAEHGRHARCASLEVAHDLLQAGAQVRACDPVAMPRPCCRRSRWLPTPTPCRRGRRWPGAPRNEFRHLDFDRCGGACGGHRDRWPQHLRTGPDGRWD